MSWLYDSTDEAIAALGNRYPNIFYADLDLRTDGWHAEICWDAMDGKRHQERTDAFQTIREAIADLLETLDTRDKQMEEEVLKQIRGIDGKDSV